MNSVRVLLGLIVLVSVSCGDNNKKLEQQLYDDVMALHDEVMPEMGSLIKLTKQLKSEIDSLQSEGIEDVNEEVLKELTGMVGELESANESMMGWMRAFEQVEEGTPHDQVMEYLSDQKEKIDKVKKDMLSAKNNAQSYFMED